MEAEQEGAGLLDMILPPRLEDAGLEDCALPPDSIKEAFLKAATALKSRAATMFDSDDEANACQCGCVNDPWPAAKDLSDKVVGLSPGQGTSDTMIGVSPEPDTRGPCVAEKGGGVVGAGEDKVVVGGGDGVEEKEKGRCCVEGAKGLENGEKVENGGGEEEEDEERESEKPILVEGFV